MRAPTLRRLRKLLARALLAAPLCLVCAAAQAPSGCSRYTRTTSTQSDAGPKQAKVCRVDPPDVTGCGGAEVVLHDTPESCGLPASGDIPLERCAELCGGFDTRSCEVSTDRDGHAEIYCHAAHPCMGRTHSGGHVAAGDGAPSLVGYLALARRLEAESVFAFRELDAHLARWRAPARLRDGCRKAAADEARHAQAMTRLLVRRGAAPERLPPARAAGFASLQALALHNEREGVVGETWGALVAAYLAEHAPDEDLRQAMADIAGEEAEHAALSFAVGAWARTRVTPTEAAALDEERRSAFAALRSTLGYRPDDEAARDLAWPSREATAGMLDALAPLLA